MAILHFVKKHGYPPLCRGVPGFGISGSLQNLPFVNGSKLTKREAVDLRFSRFKSHGVGLQISCYLESEMPEKGAIRSTQKGFGSSLQGTW